MIQMQSMLDVADNTGARQVMCIKVRGGSNRRYVHISDMTNVNIKDAAPRGRVKKGEIYNAVVVRTRQSVRRDDGARVRFVTADAEPRALGALFTSRRDGQAHSGLASMSSRVSHRSPLRVVPTTMRRRNASRARW